jgi:hypothetical protein
MDKVPPIGGYVGSNPTDVLEAGQTSLKTQMLASNYLGLRQEKIKSRRKPAAADNFH